MPSVRALVAFDGLFGRDIGAYFSGRRFGKTKLAPSISPVKPGKGWPRHARRIHLCTDRLVCHSIAMCLHAAGSLWWSGLAVIGDLFESAIKRQGGQRQRCAAARTWRMLDP